MHQPVLMAVMALTGIRDIGSSIEEKGWAHLHNLRLIWLVSSLKTSLERGRVDARALTVE